MSDGDAICAAGAGVAFTDIQRVLALFTEGLTGRHLHLKMLETGDGGLARRPAPDDPRAAAARPAPPPRQKSAAAAIGRIATDGASIHLPAVIASFDSRAYNLGAYRIAVLHQIGYLENGTFDFDWEHAVRILHLPASAPAVTAPANPVRRLLAQRNRSDLEHFFALSPRPGLLRRVFTTLEDLRVDSALRRRYPGARADLARVLAHALASRPGVDPRQPVAALLECLVRYSLGAQRSDLTAGDHGEARDRMLDLAALVETATASVYHTARAALDICVLIGNFLRHPVRHGAPLAADQEMPESAATGAASEAGGQSESDGIAEPAIEDFDGPGVDFRGELRPDLVYKQVRGGAAGTTMQEGGLPTTSDPAPAADAVTRPAAPRTHAAAARRGAHDGPRSYLYDEWDYHSRRYLKSWCRLYEQRLRGDDHGSINETRRRNAGLVRQVKRQFSMIRPESWHRVHRVSDGAEFELDSVIDALIDRRAGHSSDEYLYMRRDRGLREVAAAFLVDMSASTDFPIPEPAAAAAADAAEHDPYIWGRYGAPPEIAPTAPKRRVIDIAREALALMCEALRTLGDSHAVYGFSGDGRENVEFNVIKEFSDPLSARSWAALAAMQPRRSTRMGPAIRHAASKLARQPMRRKVMIIVSDGYPEDRDYGPDRRDREYGIQDTARALEEARRAGISTFCITIDPAGHDYLRRMCAAQRYMVIADVNALPAELSKVYRSLTGHSGNAMRAAKQQAARSGSA